MSHRSPLVMVFGTFDLLHPGHRFVLDEAMKRGEVTVVIARDSSVEAFKGRAAEQSEERRMQSVRDAFPEVTVLLGDTSDFLAPVRRIKPTLVLLGYDQKMPPNIEESDLGCRIERLPPFHPEKFKSSLRRKSGN